MHPWLGGLPFDVLYGIASNLDIQDVVHLSNTTRHLRFLLQEETLCRRLIESRARSTIEAKHASRTGFGEAVRRIYKRRMAIAAGRPASAVSLGYATDAIYSNGAVCLLERSQVRIQDLYTGKDAYSVPIQDLLDTLPNGGDESEYDSVQLLSYDAGTLVFKHTDINGANWLMAVATQSPGVVQALMRPERLRSISRLFVLQNGGYLFYGTRSASATWCSQPFREWLIQGIALRDKKFSITNENGSNMPSDRSERIQLHGFAGSEIGSTAAFRIHGGYFYAVTNYDAFDVIEVDFTSYYHCIRFPIENAQQTNCLAASTVFRRQHEDGPVNDGWNTLDLQVDEQDGNLMIIEGRAEWPLGGRNLSRGIYAHKLDWDELEVEAVQDRRPERGPTNNPLSSIPDTETKYCETPELPTWHDHIENRHDLTAAEQQMPTLARSKFRAYNFSTMSGLELAEQSCSCRGRDGFCIHLRSFSRRWQPDLRPRKSIIGISRDHGNAAAKSRFSLEKEHGSHPFAYSPISIWPRQGGALHEIMNLPAQLQLARNVEVKAWTDDRSLIYFVSAGGIGKVVCLCFDGDAPVARFSRHQGTSDAFTNPQPRGRSSRHQLEQSDPEHTRQISPARDAWDHPTFESKEAQEGFFVSTWDLEDIPDAEQLDSVVLDPWFESFGLQSKLATTSV